MNIDDVQPWIATTLRAHAPLAGVTVIEDDGTYPATPGREAALQVGGLCVVVWQIASGGLGDSGSAGAAVEKLSLAVVIEENVSVCRGVGGLGIRAETALRHVRGGLVGKPTTPSARRITCDDPPFVNFRSEQGIRRIVAMFTMDLFIPRAA